MTFVSLFKKQMLSLFVFVVAFAVVYWIQLYYGFREPLVITKEILIALVGVVFGYLLGLPLLKYALFKKGWQGF